MTTESARGDAPEFERVCATSELAPGTLRAVTLSDGTRVCVGNRGGAFFAVSDRCPHQQFPLSDGALTTEGAIVCSRHGASYDCITGRSLRGPLRDATHEAPVGRITVYETRIADADLLVRAPAVTF